MADKEVTVYMLDLGRSMGKVHNGRTISDLDWCMQYVWDKITTTIATGRKTLLGGVIGFRTDASDDDLTKLDDAYQNILVLKSIGQILMPDVRGLSAKIKPSQTNSGDVFSALAIAVDLIVKYCKKLKFKKRVILVTRADCPLDLDNIAGIAEKFREEEIELVVLGVDFDDADYGIKEEEKDSQKATNEDALKQFTEQCNGTFGTIAQAIDELGIPQLKSIRPVPIYKGSMTLGDPSKYATAITINVERFPCIMISRPPAASNFVVKQDNGTNADRNAIDGNNITDQEHALSQVYNATNYRIKDEDAPGKRRDVPREELSRGYTYGRTAVHIDESEATLTNLDTETGLDILGFVVRDKYEHFFSLSRSNYIVAQRTNDAAGLAFSALVHALYELDVCAIARIVIKDGRNPLLLLLAPLIDAETECLIDVEIPFAEDVRQHKFPPLDRIITVSGKIIKEHRTLPKPELLDAMSKYVDEMDLTTSGQDEKGEPAEYLRMDEAYSLALHSIQQAIRYRAVHPTNQVPIPSAAITNIQNPPTELLEKSEAAISQLAEIADVKKVPPKALAKRGRFGRGKLQEQPRSGLDVAALLSSHRATTNSAGTISKDNAIPEFKQIVAEAENIEVVRHAVHQLAEIIESGIRDSFGDSYYDRALEAIGVMREECLELEEPMLYNAFMRDLKQKLAEGALGGDRKEMWYKIRAARMNLIDKKENEHSDVLDNQVKEFLSPI